MTVGEPEINLNTWGLKYVRKEDKKVGQGQGYDDLKDKPDAIAPTSASTPSAVAGRRTDDRDENEVSSYGRTSDSREQTDVKPRKDADAARKKPSKSPTHGSIGDAAMTSEGKVRDAGTGLARGEGASHDSGIRNPNRRAAAQRGFHKPEAGGTPSGTPSTSLPKSKAELDLAIIKCKLLKATSVGRQGKYGEDNSGAAGVGIDTSKLSKKPQDKTDTSNTKHSTAEGVDVSPEEYKRGGDKITDPDYSAPKGQSFGSKQKSEDENTCTSCGKPKDDHYSEWGHARREHGDQKESIGDHMYKKSEDEIVHKAIELINEAYSEIDKKHDFIEETRPVRPAKRNDDDDETKKADDEHPDDKNTPEDIKTGKKRMRAQGYTSAADFDKYGDY